MVTQFSFKPIYTTAEMRNMDHIVRKVDEINKIREEKSKDIIAKGGTVLDPYTFDYLLLCNKICGASHYNMQMKIVIDSPEDYQKWIKEQTLLSKSVSDDKNKDIESTNVEPKAPQMENKVAVK
jgi:cytochrome c oxidase subunit 2